MGNYMETIRKSSKNIFGSALEIIEHVFMQCISVKIYLHLPGMIIAKRKRFFRGTLANFCKIKKCIIFKVEYRSGSKMSKFDMTLIRHHLFSIKICSLNNLYVLSLKNSEYISEFVLTMTYYPR